MNDLPQITYTSSVPVSYEPTEHSPGRPYVIRSGPARRDCGVLDPFNWRVEAYSLPQLLSLLKNAFDQLPHDAQTQFRDHVNRPVIRVHHTARRPLGARG
jgi:hypothetical protein